MSQMPTPKMPKPIAPHATAHSNIKDIHPAALDAVVAWSDLNKERDHLKALYHQTRNDLEVAHRHIAELEHQLDQVTERRDYFQRYSVQASTDLQHIVTAAQNIIAAAQTAMERSLEVAKLPEPQPIEDIEAGLADIAATLNGSKPMPSVVTQGPRTDV